MPTSAHNQRALALWRDVDSEHGRLGFTIWRTGGEIRIGKRLYRVRWAFRNPSRRQRRADRALLASGIARGGDGQGGLTLD